MSRCSVFGGGGKNEMVEFVRFLTCWVFWRYFLSNMF